MTSRLPFPPRRRMTTLVSLLILGLTASGAEAVRLNPDGTGQVLLFPYYTTRAGNQTVLSVTNHSDRAKALALRLREGRNGRATISFNVYLAPRDSWSAAVFSLGDAAPANIISDDPSCTFPALDLGFQLPDGRSYIPLFPFDYQGAREDSGPSNDDRLREGLIEIFETATLVDGSPPALAVAPTATGRPADCAALTTAWGSGYWSQNASTHLSNPTGGLSGQALVVNVGAGTVLAYAATALADFRRDPADIPLGSRNSVVMHRRPPELLPTLADAISDPAAGIAVASVDLPQRRVELTYPVPARGIDAVSAVLMADSVSNTYVSDAALGATTDWIVTLPTRPYYSDEAIVGATPIAPFTAVYPRTGDEAAASMAIPYSVYDRAGRGVAADAAVASPASLNLRFVTQVIPLAPRSAAATPASGHLGSVLLAQLQPVAAGTPRDGGWMSMNLGRYAVTTGTAPRSLRPANDGTELFGLPVLGLATFNYINSNAAPGLLANYSLALPHQHSTLCRRNTVACD